MIHCPLVSIESTGRLPAPEYVRMNDSNMLVWSRPPCVTNSSSNTSRIEVFHNELITYIVFIASIDEASQWTINIRVSSTSYDLSRVNILQPCSEYHIGVSAFNTLAGEGERSPNITYSNPGSGI